MGLVAPAMADNKLEICPIVLEYRKNLICPNNDTILISKIKLKLCH